MLMMWILILSLRLSRKSDSYKKQLKLNFFDRIQLKIDVEVNCNQKKQVNSKNWIDFRVRFELSDLEMLDVCFGDVLRESGDSSDWGWVTLEWLWCEWFWSDSGVSDLSDWVTRVTRVTRVTLEWVTRVTEWLASDSSDWRVTRVTGEWLELLELLASDSSYWGELPHKLPHKSKIMNDSYH